MLLYTATGYIPVCYRSVCGFRLPRRNFVSCNGFFHHYCPGWTMEKNKNVVLESTITCPRCGYNKKETMPTDACQWYYECKGCKSLLKPLAGHCCVFCSYGTVPCPPIQMDESCCIKPDWENGSLRCGYWHRSKVRSMAARCRTLPITRSPGETQL